MGKWAKYGKQYSKEWEKDPMLKPWMQSVAGDPTKAFCRHCKCEIKAHHVDLQRHAATTKHKQNAAKLSSARTLFDVGCSSKQVDNTKKIAELKLAAHIALQLLTIWVRLSKTFQARTFHSTEQNVQH